MNKTGQKRSISTGAVSEQSFRPVRFDSSGRLFETSGEPFEMPGLEPEAILEGLADEAAGRLHPLSQIIADRESNGLPG